tara:strand:- start:1185 stop:1394 length:210 start_codon:yes stop_codon:yes gene_type:complete
MQPPYVIMPTFCDDFPVPDEYASDKRVWHYSMSTPLGNLDGSAHENILFGHLDRNSEQAITHDSLLRQY